MDTHAPFAAGSKATATISLAEYKRSASPSAFADGRSNHGIFRFPEFPAMHAPLHSATSSRVRVPASAHSRLGAIAALPLNPKLRPTVAAPFPPQSPFCSYLYFYVSVKYL